MTQIAPLFLDALATKPVARAPVWLMRQAGRYLPEYRGLRTRHSLSALFHEPELAVEATLMPLRRFHLDAAIVFSDLLVIAEAWGGEVLYPETGGPRVILSLVDRKLPSVTASSIQETMSYVFKTISLLKQELTIPLLGFCGAPFTLLCYFLGGQEKVRQEMTQNPENFLALLDSVCQGCILYAKEQAKAGVDAIQIFDSWADRLSEEEFALFALPYWEKMQKEIQKSECKIPLIFFSRANSRYPKNISAFHPQGISFDEGVPLDVLRKLVPESIAVQGNFSPQRLAEATTEEVYLEAKQMAQSVLGRRGVIFNLGHGVLPHTPVENVQAFLEGLQG